MFQDNVGVHTGVGYPTLYMPRSCTALEIDCEVSQNVFLDVNMSSPDSEGNETLFYSGLCNVKVVESCDFNINPPDIQRESSSSSIIHNDIDQMPIIFSESNQLSFLSDNQSQVWIDPSRSPFVYNHYDTNTQRKFPIPEQRNHITVQQHNTTYITQNVYNYNDSDAVNYKNPQPSPQNEVPQEFRRLPQADTDQQDSNISLSEEDDEDYECEVYLSTQMSEEMINEKQNQNPEQKYIGMQSENNALKQLMSTDIQSTSKQRRTILFHGNDSHSGQTIQNISYNDPSVTCVEHEVEEEVIIDSASSTTKKKYECDKCKQIFHQISAFRQHMVRDHNNKNQNVNNQNKNLTFSCSECGKNLKTQKKFEIHCMGHGNPDLECHKCHKVYASKFTLRAHMKIHSRKYPCNYCKRSYETSKDFSSHLEKVHFKFVCKYDDCSFGSNQRKQFIAHNKDHENQLTGTDVYIDNNDKDFVNEVLISEEQDTKYEEFDDYVKKTTETERERIRQADSVIAKVMSNKIFLLNSKKARKHGRYHMTCDVCNKKFDRMSDLKRHLIEHVVRSTLAKSPVSKHGTLKIVCEVCQVETFAKIDHYKCHLREHAKLTLYKCTLCDKSFSDSSNFSKHKKIHGDSYFQCDLCYRKFNTKKMIAQHMEYHNQNKPLQCKSCKKTFHFLSTLNKHIKSAHTKDSKIKIKCKFCEIFFSTLKDKWDHEWMVHNVRKMIIDCLICGFKFRKYTELKRHCLDIHEVAIPSSGNIIKKNRAY